LLCNGPTSHRQSGYLEKRAKTSGRNWKKRYFVLSGHTITYYVDHKSKSDAKGSFLLTPKSNVQEVADSTHPNSFEIISEFETMRCSVKDGEEMAAWMTAIRQTIEEITSTTRAYLDLHEKGMLGNKWTTKFFLLHSNSISFHQDHMHTFKAQGLFKITAGMTVQLADQPNTIRVKEEGKKGRELVIRATPNDKDPAKVTDAWMTAINAAISDLGNASDLAVRPGETNTETTIMDGYLKTQPSRGNKNKWVSRFYALTTSALYMAEDEYSQDALAVYPLNPTCSVFETNLKSHAFELVTTQQALHIQGSSPDETSLWITELRKVISKSKVSTKDPLLAGALRHELQKYDVHFETKKPLGIVLERSREWALVKLSNAEATDVTEGSALCMINGESVMLKTYSSAIKMLTGWKPPLTLSFIKAPEREGWLEKLSRGRRGTAVGKVKNWKKRYFILKQGKLAYYAMDGESPELKGCVQLMGSAVSLVPHEEVDQNFCFRLVSGVATLIMQAETVEDMVDWSTTLYHAIAIANGGGYLLDLERERVAKEEEERQMNEKKRIAEEEAAERKRKAEEAEQLKKEMEEAEAKTRAEAEATAKAAEEARQAAEAEAAKAAAEAEAAEAEAAAAAAQEALAAAQKAEEEAATAAAAEAEALEAAKKAEEEAAAAEAEAQEAEDQVEDITAEMAELQFAEEQKKLQEAAAEVGIHNDEEEGEKGGEEDGEEAAKAATAAEEGGGDGGSGASSPDAPPPTARQASARRGSISGAQLAEYGLESHAHMPGRTSIIADEAPAAMEVDDAAAAEEPAAAEEEAAPEVVGDDCSESDAEGAEPAAVAEEAGPAETPAAPQAAAEEEDVPNKLRRGVSGQTDDLDASDTEIEAAFAILDTRGTGVLNPMQFSNLLRAAGVSMHNAYLEMSWYAQFDVDGQVGVGVDEFKEGLHKLKTDKSVQTKMVQQLMQYIKEIGSQSDDVCAF